MKIAVAGGTGTVGRHVVDVIAERGHESVVLSRSSGVDLMSGRGLPDALDGVQAVIDVTSTQTRAAEVSVEFFGTVTANLLAAELAAGVGHHLVLGIIGSDLSPHDYYAGKMRQEQLTEAGPVPWTILRAAQFHEFASQIYGAATIGPIVLAPRMHSQPIAAREVAERLVELAVDEPAGHVAELAGPKSEWMASMMRRWARATRKRGPILEVPLPGPGGRSMRDGTLLAGVGAQLGRQTFDEWLAGTTE